MDSSCIPLPVTVNIVSDTEPVECGGTLCRTSDGFVLNFDAGESKYAVTVDGGAVSLSVRGVLSYDMNFSGGAARTAVRADFGGVELELTPQSSKVEETRDGLDIKLEYALDSGAIHIDRSVAVSARFLR